LKRIQIAIITGLLAGSLITILFALNVFETLELKTLDHRFHTYASRLTPSDNIVIVTIDQNDLDYLKYKMGIVWKWPRDVYGYIINYLRSSGAKAILMDFIFSDPDTDRAEFEAGETDRILGDAIKRAGIVINSVGFYEKLQKSEFVDSIDYSVMDRFAVNVEGIDNLHLAEYNDVDIPIRPVLEPSAGIGSSNISADTDGIVRKVKLFYKFNDHIFTNSSLSLFLFLSKQSSMQINKVHKLKLNEKTITLSDKGDVYINWYGSGGPGSKTFTYYPIANVLLSYLRIKDGEAPIIDPEAFNGKIVLIGSSTPLLFDMKSTPFSIEQAYPGVEIVATVINNLLDGSTMTRSGRSLIIILVLLSSIIAALIVSYIKSVARHVVLIVGLMILFYGIAIWAFFQNTFLDIVPIESGIALAFVSMTVFNYLTEGKEKRWLRKAFSQYLSPAVIEEITTHPDKLKLGGTKTDVTILFSDIRGFTSISEKLAPEQITNILNEYLTPMSDIVFKYGGALDKYIGDAIMAFFGAPIPARDHPQKACNAALDMIESLKALKDRWKTADMPDFIQQMNIGIGINSGDVVVGNMGSESRFDYTIIGDNVNLSSRLEGANKFYGTNITLSENTYSRIKDEFICRETDFIRVMGKSIPIKIYELVKIRDGSEDDAILINNITRFQEGLFLYRNRQWDEAMSIFEELQRNDPNDKLCRVFISRCTQLKTSGVSEDWDGVYERREK
jgi:adenylate cyclase